MTVHELVPEPEQSKASDRERLMHSAVRSMRAGRTSVSVGDTNSMNAAVGNLHKAYAPLGYMLPWEVLDYVELLAQYNPDYSQAVDNIRTLANSGHTLYVDGPKRIARRVKDRLEEKARTIQAQHGGIDGLIDKLLKQGSVYGAMCGEWVLNEDMDDVIEFADVNPKTIRFFWEDGHWAPYQKVTAAQAKEAAAAGQKVRNGNHVKLNELTFMYFAFDAAPSSPYGTPPFVSALQPIAIQQDMIANLSQIVKKVGLLGIIDMTVKGLPRMAGETDGAYQARAEGYLDAYVDVVEQMVQDGGVVHYDDVEVDTYNISGNAAGATNIFKQNEEMVFSGLKSMPSVQGRSYCVTPETRVLTADLRWVPAGELRLGDELIGFDEHLGKGQGKGKSATMEPSFVEVNRRINLECLRIVTDQGEITVSKQHPMVAYCGTTGRTGDRVWREAHQLKVGGQLVWFGEPWEVDESREGGYLGGFLDGEGCVSGGSLAYAQLPGPVNDEVELLMKERGFEFRKALDPKSGVMSSYINGGRLEAMRAVGSLRPIRLLAKRLWQGYQLRSSTAHTQRTSRASILEIHDVGVQEVIALQTSTRTFISEGFLSHNSTTETYAGVAYDIIIRNTSKYQRSCKRVIERGYWLMAAMWGENPTGIRLEFRSNKTLHRLQEAQAESLEIRNGSFLWLAGLIDQTGFGQRLGYSEPKRPMELPPEQLVGGKSQENVDEVNAGNEASSDKAPTPTRRYMEDDSEFEDLDPE